MIVHTDGPIRAEAQYREEQLFRTRPRRSSRHRESKERKPMNQPVPDRSSADEIATRRITLRHQNTPWGADQT